MTKIFDENIKTIEDQVDVGADSISLPGDNAQESLDIEDRRSASYLSDILNQLRIMNIHLSMITGEEIDVTDLEA